MEIDDKIYLILIF